jgi:hypothetical protein
MGAVQAGAKIKEALIKWSQQNKRIYEKRRTNC